MEYQHCISMNLKVSWEFMLVDDVFFYLEVLRLRNCEYFGEPALRRFLQHFGDPAVIHSKLTFTHNNLTEPNILTACLTHVRCICHNILSSPKV